MWETIKNFGSYVLCPVIALFVTAASRRLQLTRRQPLRTISRNTGLAAALGLAGVALLLFLNKDVAFFCALGLWILLIIVVSRWEDGMSESGVIFFGRKRKWPAITEYAETDGQRGIEFRLKIGKNIRLMTFDKSKKQEVEAMLKKNHIKRVDSFFKPLPAAGDKKDI